MAESSSRRPPHPFWAAVIVLGALVAILGAVSVWLVLRDGPDELPTHDERWDLPLSATVSELQLFSAQLPEGFTITSEQLEIAEVQLAIGEYLNADIGHRAQLVSGTPSVHYETAPTSCQSYAEEIAAQATNAEVGEAVQLAGGGDTDVAECTVEGVRDGETYTYVLRYFVAADGLHSLTNSRIVSSQFQQDPELHSRIAWYFTCQLDVATGAQLEACA